MAGLKYLHLNNNKLDGERVVSRESGLYCRPEWSFLKTKYFEPETQGKI